MAEEVKNEENKELDKEKKTDEKEKSDKNVEKELTEVEKLKNQLSFVQSDNQKLKDEVNNWKNKFYEAYADLSNTRKSLEKDHQELIKYRSVSFIEKLIPTLDSFEMALKAEINDPVVKNYAYGFKMILDNIYQAFKDEGVTFIEPAISSKFNEKEMHAIATKEGKEDNLVTKVLTRGYKLHDRLIRPAMVEVSKVKKDEEKKESNKETCENK